MAPQVQGAKGEVLVELVEIVQGAMGGGYRGENSANNQQQQQGYRSGELHRSYLTTDLRTCIVTQCVIHTLFQVVLLCMELAPMDLTWEGDLLSTSMLLGDDT